MSKRKKEEEGSKTTMIMMMTTTDHQLRSREAGGRAGGLSSLAGEENGRDQQLDEDVHDGVLDQSCPGGRHQDHQECEMKEEEEGKGGGDRRRHLYPKEVPSIWRLNWLRFRRVTIWAN